MSDVEESLATQIDWKTARPFIRNKLRAQLFRADDAVLDDLVQEACIRLNRACRRTVVENMEGFMTTIAKRVSIDHIRSRTIETAVMTPLSADMDAAAPPDPEPFADQGDPLDRLRFMVLEFFRSGKSKCHEIALAYFAELDWIQVAQQFGRSHAAIRKQWSRCVENLREEAATEGSFLTAWAGMEFN